MPQEKSTSVDYEKLKVFLRLFFDWYMTRSDSLPESHPILVLERVEKRSQVLAKRGLEMAIHDCVEMSIDWRPEQVVQADAKLASHGALTLTAVRLRFSRSYARILQRGVVRNEKEYYLLKSILDGGHIEAGEFDEQKIEAMLSEYESKSLKSS